MSPSSRNVMTAPSLLDGQPLDASCRAFLDFDNTITRCDVLDALIRRFAVTRAWQPLERSWQAGAIGSQACMTGQLQLVRATRRQLERFLDEVPLDPGCAGLLEWLRAHGMEPVILSDSFDWLIERVLHRHRLDHLPVYANHLEVVGDRLRPSFPYANGCPRCAHCKHLPLARSRAEGHTTLFIGDGLSDLCAVKAAHVVFAKGTLRCRLQHTGQPHIPFRRLKDVQAALQRSLP